MAIANEPSAARASWRWRGNPRRHPVHVSRWAERLAVTMISLVGLVGLVAAVYLVVVLGLGHVPTSQQKTLLGFSMAAAVVSALLYVPVRRRLSVFATGLVQHEHGAADDVLRTLGSRLTRVIPLDELLLQLAESLRKALALDAVEIWTGSGGLLERVVSDPDRGAASLILTPAEETVVARAGVSGPAWLAVWLPQLLAERSDVLRMAPVISAGELLGLIVVERPPVAEQFDDEDARVLAEVAGQVGLALRNVRLDSALHASLDELRRQAEELRASRARVVAAADAERLRIERNLHDGAQQHLVALGVHLRLAEELFPTDPEATQTLLAQLRDDVHAAIEQLRALAHGIYPPLLLERGLEHALRAEAARAAVRASVEAPGLGRYSPEIEATVYFCCLEALQNVAKHAAATNVVIAVREQEGGLLFDVVDDGAGFDPSHGPRGAGLTNMSDRLGALGGRLSVRSKSGGGTSISGTIPLPAEPMQPSSVKVLVADDQPQFLSAARSVVERTSGFELVGEAASGEEALELAALLRPDLMVIDITMPGIGGIEAARRIISRQPDAVAVLVSTYREEDLPPAAHTCGAVGYIHKEAFGPDSLRDVWGRRPTARRGRGALP
jgi:signal transduction histidine kinase/CheY-like chemotaxis protein